MPDFDARKRQGRQAEDAVQIWAQDTEIHHKGWPDFLCVKDGLVFAVEVKSGNASLTPEQRKVVAILAGLGIKTFIWSPESPYLIELRERRTDVTADVDAVRAQTRQSAIANVRARRKRGLLRPSRRSTKTSDPNPGQLPAAPRPAMGIE